MAYVTLPTWIYGYRARGQTGTQVDNERIWTYVFDHITTTEQGGLYTFYKGCAYPEEFACEPGAMAALNVVKSLTVTLLETFPLRGLEHLLINYNKTCWRVMGPWYLRPDLNCDVAKQIKIFVFIFLRTWGISFQTAYQAAINIAHLFEFDIGYRYPLQDLADNTYKGELWSSPRKVLKKISKIYYQRSKEDNVHGLKIRRAIKLLRILLLIPKVKKSFYRALAEIDFTKIQPSICARYHCMMLGDYNYFGLTIEQRIANLELIHPGGLPPRIQL